MRTGTVGGNSGKSYTSSTNSRKSIASEARRQIRRGNKRPEFEDTVRDRLLKRAKNS
jgi:hypothetical protein